MKLSDVKDVAILAVIAGAAYLLYSKGSKAAAALTTVGEAIGSGLFDYFHPNQTGEMLFYAVKFPGGAQRAVPSQSVDPDGFFYFEGKRYRLLIDKRITSGTNKTALPA